MSSQIPKKPSLIGGLPPWAMIAVIGLAVGLAVYFGRDWPLKALAWLDRYGPEILASKALVMILGSKALAKTIAVIGGGAVMLWGGVGTLKKRSPPSRVHGDSIGPDEKEKSHAV